MRDKITSLTISSRDVRDVREVLGVLSHLINLIYPSIIYSTSSTVADPFVLIITPS